MANQMLIVLACCTLYAAAATEFPQCRIPKPDEPCGCTKEIDPVCGRDGVWYTNACELKCAGQKWNYKACCPADKYPGLPLFIPLGDDNSLVIDPELKEQKCKKPDTENPCVCTRQYDPVCGTNNQWYPNLCTLECEDPKFNIKATADSCCTDPKPGSQLPMLGGF